MNIVIITCPKGYIAELRFNDRKKDCSISADTHEEIYTLINKVVKERS